MEPDDPPPDLKKPWEDPKPQQDVDCGFSGQSMNTQSLPFGVSSVVKEPRLSQGGMKDFAFSGGSLSGQSMDTPLMFNPGPQACDDSLPFGVSSVVKGPRLSQGGMKDSAFSGGSLSGQSMDTPLMFNPGPQACDDSLPFGVSSVVKGPRLSQGGMKDSAFSGGSLSGQSMDTPLMFNPGPQAWDDSLPFGVSSVVKGPRLSQGGMKDSAFSGGSLSGQSMDTPLMFNPGPQAWDASLPFGPRDATKGSDLQGDQSLESTLKLVWDKLNYFMKKEWMRLHGILNLDDQLKREEEEEESMRGTREPFLKIIEKILQSMDQRKLAQRLWGKRNSLTNDVKKSLQMRCRKVNEGIAQEGEKTRLNDIYTELVIVEGVPGHINEEHEVRQVESANRKNPVHEKRIRREDLLEHCQFKRNMLTMGVAGIGKTVLTQKVTLDWAEDRAYQNFDFIFPFTFRELNLVKEEMSLVELVHYFFPETKKLKPSNFEEVKVLFIFDGLDESKVFLNKSNKVLTKVTQPATVEVLLTNLVRGNVLPNAHLWITTRPAGANSIPSECVDMVTEVRGFTDTEKKEYFKIRFRNNEQNTKDIIAKLETTPSLYIMCHIPIFCWITATVMEDVLKNEEKEELPETLTLMYIHFVVVQLKRKNIRTGGSGTDSTWSNENKNIIKALGKLAFQHLLEKKIIFYESDLKKSEIEVKDASKYSGVLTQIFREEKTLYKDTIFCFVHLSLQEFLAALYVHRKFCKYGVKLLQKEQPAIASGLHLKHEEFYQSALNEAMESEDGHLDLFLRFLMGLSVNSNQRLLGGLPVDTGSSWTNLDTSGLVKKQIETSKSHDRIMNLCHCLKELQDKSLEEEVQKMLASGHFSKEPLSSHHWSTLTFLLLTSQLETFDINKYGASEETFLKLLPVIKASHKVLLRGCGLSMNSCEVVSKMFSSPSSNLIDVDLSDNTLKDSAVSLLCEGLKDPACHIETFRLKGCGLSTNSCEVISTIFRSSFSKLIEVDLSSNDLKDSGVKLLCEGLKDPNCRIETFRLKGCGLSMNSCEVISTTFSSSSSNLIEVELSNNDLKDDGVMLLCEGLKDPACQIQTFRLRLCGLSMVSCGHFSSVLCSPFSRLRNLDLSANNLMDTGLKLLSDGPENSQSQLETLRLSGCLITEVGCGYLESALKSNLCHLRELDVSSNNLVGHGLDLLNAALKSPDLRLETLTTKYSEEWGSTQQLRHSFHQKTPKQDTAHQHLQQTNNDRTVDLMTEDQNHPYTPDRTIYSEEWGSTQQLRHSFHQKTPKQDTAHQHLQRTNNDRTVDLMTEDQNHPYTPDRTIYSEEWGSTQQLRHSFHQKTPKQDTAHQHLQRTNNDRTVDLMTEDQNHPYTPDRTIYSEEWGSTQQLRHSFHQKTPKQDTAHQHLQRTNNNRTVDLMTEDQNHPYTPDSIMFIDEWGTTQKLRKCFYPIFWNSCVCLMCLDFCQITLNPVTAHQRLRLTNNNKTVALMMEDQNHPFSPDRFISLTQLMCENSLAGQHYWEVDLRGDVLIAVTYRQHRATEELEFGQNSCSWSLRCLDGFSYEISHNKLKQSITSVCDRVGVYVDWSSGTLSFYRVTNDTLSHIHTFNTTFSQPLYPAFGLLGSGSSVTLCDLDESYL